jgi:uncharacterized protein YecT (DUF1311 family)
MKTLNSSLTVLALLVSSFASHLALANSYDATYNRCSEDPGQFASCVSRAFQSADGELNLQYQSCNKNGSLIAAERAWITLRDSHCQFVGEMLSGHLDVQAEVASACKVDMTLQRTQDLRDTGGCSQ